MLNYKTLKFLPNICVDRLYLHSGFTRTTQKGLSPTCCEARTLKTRLVFKCLSVTLSLVNVMTDGALQQVAPLKLMALSSFWEHAA